MKFSLLRVFRRHFSVRWGETESKATIFMPFYYRIYLPFAFWGSFKTSSLLNSLPSQKIIGTIGTLVFEDAALMLGGTFTLSHNKNLPTH